MLMLGCQGLKEQWEYTARINTAEIIFPEIVIVLILSYQFCINS